MLKKLVMLSVVAGIAFADTRPKPPVPTQDLNQPRGNCKVPEFLVNIPVQMEDDYTSCVNDRYKPSKALVEVILKQQIDKKAEFVNIEPAPRFFTRVYKITYKVGGKTKAMICNDKMTYCLDDKPIASRER